MYGECVYLEGDCTCTCMYMTLMYEHRVNDFNKLLNVSKREQGVASFKSKFWVRDMKSVITSPLVEDLDTAP